LPDADTNGRHTLERTLVQIVAAVRPEFDFADCHKVACAAIHALVDPTFLCVLVTHW